MEYVGIAEVAEMAKVKGEAVSNWRRRHADFPKPIQELRAGPVFAKHEIETWLREHVKRSKVRKICP